LEKLEGVTGAFVDDQITILLAEDRPLDQDAVTGALKEFKINISEVKRADRLPF